MKKKIRYVSLESSAFLVDLDFLSMSYEERGLYFTLILHLYENNGCLDMKKVLRGNFSSCKNFRNVFEKIKHKFLIKNGKISHKRVNRELRRARQISQLQRENGLKGNHTRWENYRSAIAKLSQSDSKGVPKRSEGEAKGSEDKRSEEKRSEAQEGVNSDTAIKVRLSVSQLAAKLASPSGSSDDSSQRLASPTAGTVPTDFTMKLIYLNDGLCKIFPQRTPADTSSIRNLANWVINRIKLGLLQDKIIGNVLAIARDSKKGKSRKPIAVFYAQLKTDLGYKQDG
jgi:uncharacterized protein YdaU (DUF1376 family)